MADTDLVESLRGYFMETETTHPCDALRKSDYETFHSLIDQALSESPEDARLWFWKGWGHQFFQKESEFEWAEDAYERALVFNPEFAPAVVALSYLYWSTAYQRAKQEIIDDIKRRFKVSPDSVYEDFETTDIIEVFFKADERARATVSYEAAQTAWRRLDADLIVEGLNEEVDQSGDLLVWYQHFVEMSEDLALSPAELGRIHWNFGYGFFNYLGLSEFDPVVKEAFEAVKRHSGPSRQLADALAYLAMANSERNEDSPNPKHAYALLQRLLDLYEESGNDRAIVKTEAYESYDRFLRDFYVRNPVFCKNNPRKCTELFERSQQLGLIPTKWTSDVRSLAGHFYFQIGKYEDAVEQFELGRSQILRKVELQSDFALSLARTRRVDEAIRFLEEVNGIQSNNGAETLLYLLREIKVRDENRSQLVYDFSKALQDAPKRPTEAEIEVECRRNWPEYWNVFPDILRRMIVTAEYVQRSTSSAEAWDFSMLGAQWGKIAEIALEYGFVRPFSEYVKRYDVTSAKYALGVNAKDNATKQLIGPNLSLDKLRKASQFVRIGLLWAASDDPNHPVMHMINKLELDTDLWRKLVPQQLDEIRHVRNRFVHPDQLAEADDVARLRAILMTEGLLAYLGHAMFQAQKVLW